MKGDGFRPNVRILVVNDRVDVLWARRKGSQDAWQFPQGGIQTGEAPEQAMYRELREELGLPREAVQLLARTGGWLRYQVPKRLRRPEFAPHFKGQKQKWFLLRLLADDRSIRLAACDHPEFDAWRWVSYWYPIGQVIDFKRDVYRRALGELAPHLTDSPRA